MTANPPGLTIAAVERETGLSKDVLRKWEARYGFPTPLRDDKGERIYPTEQLTRLRLIKRLLDTGLRPARVVGESPETLAEMLGQRQPDTAEGNREGFEQRYLERLRRHDVPALRRDLYRVLLREGLPRFVQDNAAALVTSVGGAWSSGELDIYEEHLFAECMRGILGDLVAELNDEGGRPRVLLTTLPGEAHGLGLLLAAALMSLEGAYCLNLGTQTPSAEIENATRDLHIDLVALSFSVRYPARQIAPAVEGLGALLPASVDVWIGGNGSNRAGDLPEGVRVITDLADVAGAIEDWRLSRSRGADS